MFALRLRARWIARFFHFEATRSQALNARVHYSDVSAYFSFSLDKTHKSLFSLKTWLWTNKLWNLIFLPKRLQVNQLICMQFPTDNINSMLYLKSSEAERIITSKSYKLARNSSSCRATLLLITLFFSY